MAFSLHLRAFSLTLLVVPTDTHVTLQSCIELYYYFTDILFNIPIKNTVEHKVFQQISPTIEFEMVVSKMKECQ